jgi:phospholipid/cholesterol/gamma-HCH transport system ATP-binding protein
MIEVKDIYKSFGDNDVLRGISSVFHPGKNNLIIGGSGSGKTTLLKCIVGLHEPTKGDVLFDGQDFTHMNFEERVPIRKQIGMLFQNSALFDSMTVEENIMFPLNLFTEMSKSEKLDRANFCLARAIAMQPKYLFVDEPNSGLDPKTSIVIDELIAELTEEYQITTVVVTHDMNSVMGIGDHIIFLYQGQKWWEGSNKEIAHTDNKELNDFVFASKFMQAAKERL